MHLYTVPAVMLKILNFKFMSSPAIKELAWETQFLYTLQREMFSWMFNLIRVSWR